MSRIPAITAPGAVNHLPLAVFRSDCTATPALDAEGAWQIERECPAFYWAHSPSNRQAIEREQRFEAGDFDFLVLLFDEDFERRVAHIDAPNYYALDARRARDTYREAGQIPLLTHELDALRQMRAALRNHSTARLAFTGGATERSLFWIDRETGAWCKARPAYTLPVGGYIVDYAATSSANPDHARLAMARNGWHLRGAWYLDAIDAVYGLRPKRVALIVQARTPPYLISTCWIDDEDLGWGTLLARHARAVFADCLQRREWPGYRPIETPTVDGAFALQLPPFERRALELRHEAGGFEFTSGKTGT
ncbi:MAG: PD-(D/E)XK nuclease-like domain-containing protein [Stellaceae bacterium]